MNTGAVGKLRVVTAHVTLCHSAASDIFQKDAHEYIPVGLWLRHPGYASFSKDALASEWFVLFA